MTNPQSPLDAKGCQLFLDCDGVLTDFDAAFTAQFGHPPRVYEEHNGSTTFWRNIREEAKEFYRHLPLMSDARELYEAVAHLRPIILTGCPAGGWAEAQKQAWAAEHFPGVPMITCMSKDKRNYCKPGDILIDDWPKYRDRWEGAGGKFILHTDAKNSIAALSAIQAGEPTGREAEELEHLRKYAHAATVAITGLTCGGSEYFGRKIGELYTADLEFCVSRIRESRDAANERWKEARREVASLRKAAPVAEVVTPASQLMIDALVAAKRAMWIDAQSEWTMADFKNWALIQQIDAALVSGCALVVATPQPLSETEESGQ